MSLIPGSLSPPTGLFGWIAVDPNQGTGGAAVICESEPGQWALLANISPLCGDWPPATCNVDLILLYIIISVCDSNGVPVVDIGDFFWVVDFQCYDDVWFQRLDLGLFDQTPSTPLTACWETAAHFTPATGWVSTYTGHVGYPIEDYGIIPGHRYLYRAVARISGVMQGIGSQVSIVGVPTDCAADSGSEGSGGSDGSGGSGAGSSGSGGSGGSGSSGSDGLAPLTNDSELYVACGNGSGSLWLPNTASGFLAGHGPIQLVDGVCYQPASPVQTRTDPPDTNPTAFFTSCAICAQGVSNTGSGSVGDGNPGGDGGSGGSSSNDPCAGYGGSGLSACPCKCSGYFVTVSEFDPDTGAQVGGYTTTLGPNGSCGYSGLTPGGFDASLAGGPGSWTYSDSDVGTSVSVPTDGSGCPKPGTYGSSTGGSDSFTDSNGNYSVVMISSNCGICVQGGVDCPSGGCE